jgi:hypothetical protein
MPHLKTLEDLKLYLELEYEQNKNRYSFEDILTYLEEKVDKFDLSYEESEYAMPIESVNEDQVNAKTMINSQKAYQILLKKKNK